MTCIIYLVLLNSFHYVRIQNYYIKSMGKIVIFRNIIRGPNGLFFIMHEQGPPTDITTIILCLIVMESVIL